MSDGLSNYYKAAREPVSVRGWHRWDAPVVPRRVTEHGRMMWAEDLGLPSSDAGTITITLSGDAATAGRLKRVVETTTNANEAVSAVWHLQHIRNNAPPPYFWLGREAE